MAYYSIRPRNLTLECVDRPFKGQFGLRRFDPEFGFLVHGHRDGLPIEFEITGRLDMLWRVRAIEKF